MDQNKLNELKTLIKAELDLCNQAKTPTICAMSENAEQYPKLEKMIIDRIKIEGKTIGAAIVSIEREFNINMTND